MLKYCVLLHLKKSDAQVAEPVDALVSNTSSFGSVGSTPTLGTSRAGSTGSFFFDADLPCQIMPLAI